MTQEDALLVLNAIAGIGPLKAKQLIDFYGSAVDVLAQGQEGLVNEACLTPELAVNIVHFSKDKFLSDEYNLSQAKGVQIIFITDEAYPSHLKNIPGAPLVLYVAGQVSVLNNPAVAVVGSRACSHYGRQVAYDFAFSFAKAAINVVSGLARGIDTAAHQGCLKGQGLTVAVMAGGLTHLYPAENKKLFEAIIVNGAVVSEMPMKTAPLPGLFLRRNRIISGLSEAVLVVEAGEKSGALITASYAAEQGRDVFAVPANIDYTSAKGSNLLIKDGAALALSPLDVLRVIKGQLELELGGQSPVECPHLSEEEMFYLKQLSLAPVHIDVLIAQQQDAQGVGMKHLLNLEIKGLIKKLPGSYYVKA